MVATPMIRGAKSTLFFLAVLAGLGAYIYFVESKRPTSSEAEQKKDKVFTVEADKIQELKVKAAGGESTTLKKSGTAWQIAEPSQLKADATEVSGITSNLSTLEVQRVVEENPADLKQYGLAAPRIEVAFKGDQEKEFRRLLVGDKTATGGDLYAKRSTEKRVFLISGYLESTFNRTTFDLRDKIMLSFDRDKADSVSITGPDGNIRLVKNESEWRLTEPWPVRADYGTVEGLIGRINTAQMKSIAAEDPTDLKEYGLDTPAVTVSIGAGSSRAALAVGKASPDGAVYVRDVSRPMVFTVESSLADELKKAAAEYRRKDIFEFRPFNATRFEITRDGQSFVYEKVKGTGKDAQEKWQQTAPEKRDIDASKFEGFLSKMSNLRALSFPAADAKTGLETPVAGVTTKYEGGRKQETVKFGKVESDMYASRGDEPGAAKIEATDYDQAMRDLSELQAPPATTPAKPPEKK
ncbi:MAG: DUF4340 domain-containing protein [Acidobacteria bacterium]|nr:DUF4340 domain-containing protein [Acidobacteriota bacterium]